MTAATMTTDVVTAKRVGRVKAYGSNLVIPQVDEIGNRIDLLVPASQVERFLLMGIGEMAKLRRITRRRKNRDN